MFYFIKILNYIFIIINQIIYIGFTSLVIALVLIFIFIFIDNQYLYFNAYIASSVGLDFNILLTYGDYILVGSISMLIIAISAFKGSNIINNLNILDELR